jgi:hypothetical protein
MTESNPCRKLYTLHRRFATLGTAEFALRSMLSVDEDEFNSQDSAICGYLDELWELQFIVAQELLTQRRRRDAWLEAQREDAAKQVADSE